MPISRPITQEERKKLCYHFPKYKHLMSTKQMDLLTLHDLMDLAINREKMTFSIWQSEKLNKILSNIENYPDM